MYSVDEKRRPWLTEVVVVVAKQVTKGMLACELQFLIKEGENLALDSSSGRRNYVPLLVPTCSRPSWSQFQLFSLHCVPVH